MNKHEMAKYVDRQDFFMNVVDCGCEDFKGLEKLIDSYNLQVQKGIIKPTRVVPEFFPREFRSDPRKRLLVAMQGEIIKGHIEYCFQREIGDKGYDRAISSQLRRMGLGEFYQGDVIQMQSMESYPPYEGTGGALVEYLKSKKDVKAAYAISLGSSVGFYDKMGFERVYVPHINIVMIWKSGQPVRRVDNAAGGI